MVQKLSTGCPERSARTVSFPASRTVKPGHHLKQAWHPEPCRDHNLAAIFWRSPPTLLLPRRTLPLSSHRSGTANSSVSFQCHKFHVTEAAATAPLSLLSQNPQTVQKYSGAQPPDVPQASRCSSRSSPAHRQKRTAEIISPTTALACRQFSCSASVEHGRASIFPTTRIPLNTSVTAYSGSFASGDRRDLR